VKKWIAACCVVALAAGVAACGSDDNVASNSKSSSSSSSSGGGKKYKMTLIAGVKGDEFYLTMNCGAQEAAKAAGVQLDFQGPDEFDASQQTPIVNAVAAKKPDAVLIAPTDTKAMYAPIKQMAANGTKIVLVDTTLDDPSMAVSQIASDNEKGGEAAAQELTKLIGGKGFETGAKAAGLDYIGQQYDDDDPAKAASIVTATLAKDPDLKGIFAANLFSAEGAASGLKQAGKQNAVKIVGFDAGPKQVEDLKAGTVQALIAQRPAEIGKDGVEQALAALQGKPTQKQIGTDFAVITKDNLDQNQDALYKSTC